MMLTGLWMKGRDELCRGKCAPEKSSCESWAQHKWRTKFLFHFENVKKKICSVLHYLFYWAATRLSKTHIHVFVYLHRTISTFFMNWFFSSPPAQSEFGLNAAKKREGGVRTWSGRGGAMMGRGGPQFLTSNSWTRFLSAAALCRPESQS